MWSSDQAVPETELLDSSIQKGRAQLSVKAHRLRPSRYRDSVSSSEGDDTLLERKVPTHDIIMSHDVIMSHDLRHTVLICVCAEQPPPLLFTWSPGPARLLLPY